MYVLTELELFIYMRTWLQICVNKQKSLKKNVYVYMNVSVLQSFDRRSKYVKAANEAELWKQVTVEYMTDESDKEDGSDGTYVYA